MLIEFYWRGVPSDHDQVRIRKLARDAALKAIEEAQAGTKKLALVEEEGSQDATAP